MVNKIKVVAFVLIFILSLIDGAATLFWVTLGIAEEMNPLMAPVLSYSPIAFIVVKTLLVSLGLFVCYRYYMYRLVNYGIFISFCAYLTVFIMHSKMFFSLYL